MSAASEALRDAADKLEQSRSQKGIASRALDPGKAYAIALLRDQADAIDRAES